MKKVISFSVWGDNTKYLSGINENIKLVKQYYSDYECWFYIHEPTVPKHIIDLINNYDNCKIIYKNDSLQKGKPMMWRFEPIDDPDVEIMLSRDTDTRILMREKLAVDEWLLSENLFHIMRDHPHHNFCILAGMFGTKKIPQIPSWTNIINLYKKTDNRMYDQDFLRDYIYPIIKNNSMIHATFNKMEHNAKNFPINYCNDFNFVGEYVYFDESRSQEHINILKQSL